jgi:hypothetical protein
VLKNTRVPTEAFENYRFSLFIQALNAHLQRPTPG